MAKMRESRDSREEGLSHLYDEEAAAAYLSALAWRDGVVCPRCGSDNVSARAGGAAYRCNGCRRDFTIRTGAIFERSHLPLHVWLRAAHLLIESGGRLSSAALGRELGLRQASAWQLLDRLRSAGPEAVAGLLSGGAGGGVLKTPVKDRGASMAISRQELAGKIYERIKDGSLRAGDRLPTEREIAARFNTSRGSVREAVIVLETLGFIEVRGKEGIYVRTLSDEDINRSLDVYSAWPTEMLPHTFQVRLILESEAAGLAALNRTEADVSHMATCIEGLERVYRDRPSDWSAQGIMLNDLFHHQVIEAAHNPVLTRIHEGLLRIIKKAYATFGSETMATPLEQWEERVIKGHRVILDAVEARDEIAARNIMRSHLEITFKKQDALYRERIQGVMGDR